jgi:Tfp pilus assembly PilM family ATPase
MSLIHRIFPRSVLSPIGIDMGSRVIKAVQMISNRTTGQASAIASAAVLRKYLDDPFAPQDVQRLVQVMARRGFKGRDVILAAPSSRLESDIVELPARSSGAPVDELAAAEIARVTKLEPSSYEAACWDVPVARQGAGAGTSMLAVALRHTDAEALAAPFDLAGLRVRAMEPAGCALARACDEVDKASIVALLDLGWRGGTVNLISEGDVLYQRVLYDCGIGPLYRQLADRHGFNDESADMVLCDDQAATTNAPAMSSLLESYVTQTAQEVGASLAFARHRYPTRPVSSVKVVGGGAKINGLAKALAAAIALPVEISKPPHFVKSIPGEACDRDWAQIALAAGLALHQEART